MDYTTQSYTQPPIQAMPTHSFRTVWIAAGIIFSITLLFCLYKINRSPDVVPLHYTVLLGVDRLGSRFELLIFPGLLGIIIAANWIVNRSVNNVFVRGVLAYTSVCLGILVFLALYAVTVFVR